MALFEESRKHSEALWVQLGTPEARRDLTISLDRLGKIALSEGDRAGAKALFEESRKHWEVLGD